jgi:hypothetical protein
VLSLLVLAAASRPAVFPDTLSYMDNGANVYRAAAHVLHILPPPKPLSPKIAFYVFAQNSYNLTAMAAREPWYGVFARPLEWIGTLWLLAAVQSLIAAWLIWLSWRTFIPAAPTWTSYAVQGVTAVFSTLPFIAGLAMPDIFLPCLILAVTLLLVSWDELAVAERATLAGFAVFATTVHGGSVLLAIAMVAVCGVVAVKAVVARKPSSVRIYTVILALCGGVTAVSLGNTAINIINRQPPGRPPFLASRLIADGPGRAYLKSACAKGAHYLFCKHIAKPLDDTQAILFGDKKVGVWAQADPVHRQMLSAEEGPIVINTILFDPVGVAKAALSNWISQLGMVSVEATLVDQRMYAGRKDLAPKEVQQTSELWLDRWKYRGYRNTILPKLVRRAGDCSVVPESCRPRLSIPAARWLQRAEFAIALLSLAVLVVAMWREARSSRWLQALGLVSFAIVANALMCGALIGAYPRYQSAVAWLPIMMAAIGMCHWLGGRAHSVKRSRVQDWRSVNEPRSTAHTKAVPVSTVGDVGALNVTRPALS